MHINELAIIHTTKDDLRLSAWLPEDQPVWLWKTCVRQLAFTHVDHVRDIHLPEEVDLLIGDMAFEFALQIICGLHSPMKAETEVFGQFKKCLEVWEFQSHPWGPSFLQITQDLLQGAKQIRGQFLTNTGTQSYGSYVRRHLKGVPSVHVFGSGQLVEEILPWLAKSSSKVIVHCRNPQKFKDKFWQLMKKDNNTSEVAFLESLESSSDNQSGALIVAAPMTANEVKQVMARKNLVVSHLVDLRGESRVDPLILDKKTMSRNLDQVFQTIENNQSHLDEKVQSAQRAIRELVNEKLHQVKIRPFGWDDLCA